MRGRCLKCYTEGVDLFDGLCVLCAEGFTPDDRIAEVAHRLRERGLIDLARAAAGAVELDHVLGRSRHVPIPAARHRVWRALSAEGLSSVDISRIWGVHHTSVLLARGTLAKAPGIRATWEAG